MLFLRSSSLRKAYGKRLRKHVWFPNKQFAELFETAEEILEGDRRAASEFSMPSLFAGVNAHENRRKRPPEVMPTLIMDASLRIR